jgi:hypothetical protein
MCDIPFDRSILQLSNGIRHVMPSNDRMLELTAKHRWLSRLTAGCVFQWVNNALRISDITLVIEERYSRESMPVMCSRTGMKVMYTRANMNLMCTTANRRVMCTRAYIKVMCIVPFINVKCTRVNKNLMCTRDNVNVICNRASMKVMCTTANKMVRVSQSI